MFLLNPCFRRSIIYISLCLFFIFFHSINLSQNLNIQTYTFKDGLPTQAFYDAVQDTTGRMWFACKKGLTVYDGYEWKFLSEKEGVPMAEYIKIDLDLDGNIWTLTKSKKNSIIYRSDNQWIKIPPIANNNLVIAKTVIDFTILNSQNMPKPVVISTDSIYVYNGSKWRSLTNLFPQNIKFNSLNKRHNRVFVSTSEGLFFISEDLMVSKFELNSSQNNREVFCISFLKDHTKEDGESFYILGNTWLGIFDQKSFSILKTGFYINTTEAYEYYSLDNDRFGNVYFGNNGILYSYNIKSEKFKLINKSSGLLTEGAFAIFIDTEENKWITSPRGISRILGTPFENYNSQNGLLADEVSAVAEISDGTIVLGHNEGISTISNNKITTMNLSASSNLHASETRVLDLLAIKNDVLIAATNLGVGRMNSSLEINWLNKPFDDYCSAFAEDKMGKVYVTGVNKILKVLNNEILPAINFNFHIVTIGRELIINNDSSILMTTNGQGVVKIVNDQATLIKSSIDNFNNVYSVFIHDDSTTLVGTVAGLCKIKDSVLVEHSLKNLSISDPIYFIEAGNKPGSIWFGLDKGVIYWHEGEARFYDPNSGLAGYETNRHAGFLDSKGNFWIGTDNGLSKFQAGNEDIPNPKPLIDLLYLEDLTYKKYPVNSNIELDYDHNSFSIHYRCLSFYDESNVLFDLKLLDHDGEIIEEFTTREKAARFSNLNSGDYRISLIAKNPIGVYSNELITNIITVSTPFYNQIWFYTIIAAVLILIGLIIQNFYSQKIYSRKLEAEIKERTNELQNAEKVKLVAIYENIEYERRRISRDLHDYLGQILTSAKLKLEAFQHSKSLKDEQFEESIELLQDTGKVLRIIVHNLHPLEIEGYGLAASIKMICHEINKDSPIKVNYFESNYTGKLNKKDEVMAFRIVQEALNNVIKHANCNEISVTIEELNSKLLITVLDNGKGFNQNGEGLSKDKLNTFGLVSMKQRAELIGAELEIKSEINTGTKIKLGIPLYA